MKPEGKDNLMFNFFISDISEQSLRFSSRLIQIKNDLQKTNIYFVHVFICCIFIIYFARVFLLRVFTHDPSSSKMLVIWYVGFTTLVNVALILRVS